MPPQSFKLTLLTHLTKLADRDTHALALSSLTTLAHSLTPQTLPTFTTTLSSITLNDKPLLRKHALSLLTLVTHNYRNAISPHFTKIVSLLVRLLPDPMARAEAVALARAIAVGLTKPAGLFTVFKPVLDCLFTAQDQNSQVTAALCLGAVVESSVRDEEVERLGKLVAKLERLIKSDGYKGKAAVLGLIGSVVWVGGVGSRGGAGGLKSVIGCLVECLKSEDWGVRKGAADALGKVAVKERDSVSEFKGECVKVLESRRFDKVKEVREIMNQTLESWKQVPDLSDEASPPPRSQGSSKEDASDGHYPPSGQASSATPQTRKRLTVAARSAQIGNTIRKRSPLKASDKNVGPTTYGKMEEKKTFSRNIAVSRALSMAFCQDDDLMDGDENLPDRMHATRTPISKSSNGKMHNVSSFKSGSRVVPCGEESLESTGVSINVSKDMHKSQSNLDELLSIRKHLVQIEEQQSGLMDLLQKFVGSTQNGMRSLEARVHGLEMTLDEISYDLAVNSGRMTNADTMGTRCCLLPNTEFLSPKFWRKPYATSRYSAGTQSMPATRYKDNIDSSRLQSRRFRPNVGAGFIVNPLADRQSETRGVSEVGNL